MTHRAFGEVKAALGHLNETLEMEAKRIAHALHDEAGQLLAIVHVKLDATCWKLPHKTREQVQEARKLLDQVEEQLRHLAQELRPAGLDDLGLVPALEFLAAGVSRRTGLHVAIEASDRTRLPARTETTLYRVVQEALRNAAKHARASSVLVRLWRTPDFVFCCVRDDGVGFEPERAAKETSCTGLGLLGMRERLHALGGTFQIHSAPARGTELIIEVPQENGHGNPNLAG